MQCDLATASMESAVLTDCVVSTCFRVIDERCIPANDFTFCYRPPLTKASAIPTPLPLGAPDATLYNLLSAGEDIHAVTLADATLIVAQKYIDHIDTSTVKKNPTIYS